ncbi:hypothetical protein PLICRDRAFT_179891 [Plicaturopsis crispa FD-325 SS-3]|uniref:Uncharacterized protein n=1 Tax=Plicaturopsis crispa FD-325 SS-3 TaxID=944288 RepID=A0A0C9SR18_PLICR|nr:hypothetical protein PLICRDRAFT_179891 [Plicaturopsis crispa FD-325 SS-3]
MNTSTPPTPTPLPPAAPTPPKSDPAPAPADWVQYPPIPADPHVKRFWLYGWRLDPALISAWVDHILPRTHKDSFACSDPFGLMARYSGYSALLPVFAVPEGIEEPVDGVNYYTCDAWALSSNYSRRRYFTRPSPEQLRKMVDILGEPYWFLDGLGDPGDHYQYYI